MRTLLTTLLWACMVLTGYSADISRSPNPKWQIDRWPAEWIAPQERPIHQYGVYFFRKNFTLDQAPSQFIINISADNRYRLYVNGRPVCWGPARGDVMHWYYETVDISSYLTKGKNTLAVTVWDFGQWVPGAQMSMATGLIVLGDTEAEKEVNTNNSWRYIRSEAYSPIVKNRHDVGCGDCVDGNKYTWGWTEANFDDSQWLTPAAAGGGQPYGNSSECRRFLLPRDIPLMVEEPQRLKSVRTAEGISVPKGFLEGLSSLTVPAGKKVSLLLDQSTLTTAYPELTVSGGKGSEIRLLYTEGMFDEKNIKGNRNDVEGRKPHEALSDIFRPDGGKGRLFRPLWFKTYRYITLEIETKDHPLTIDNLIGQYTGYPFSENGSFDSNDPSIADVWKAGWRTARLCAHETYFDCPYYEQLQYIGDTRIQALISLYVSGDDRLMRKAIKCFDWSRSYEGITTSRYPSYYDQFIPTFSLIWIAMIHDYYMYRQDDEFIRSCIPGIKSVLEWYSAKIDQQTGILGATPHWNFIDWALPWKWSNTAPLGGTPDATYYGGSAITSLLMVYAMNNAVELLDKYDEQGLANKYRQVASSVKQRVVDQCWDKSRGLMWDDLKKTAISQHVNILAILSDAIPPSEQKALYNRLLTDKELIEVTIYFRFYLIQAMKKVGEANNYVSMLTPWHDMLAMGLTTFAERPEPSRSDCHAWSASPNYDLLATVCGIEPASPGFSTVKIEPHPGPLNEIKGKVPHPKGMIEVALKRKGETLAGRIVLPRGLSGHYLYNGRRVELKEGENRL